MDNAPLASIPTKPTIEALWRLEKIILDTLDFNQVVIKIVDSVLIELGNLKRGYQVVVLSLIDNEEKALKKTSLSLTIEATKALETNPVSFGEIILPLSAKDNMCVQSAVDNKIVMTHDWSQILVPYYTPEDAKKAQRILDIKTTIVFPVAYHGVAQGVLVFGISEEVDDISQEEKELIRGFADIVGLAVQNARLYTQREETAEQLRQANLKLQELDKLKDEFVTLASHELRTPMTAIRGSLSTILDGYSGEISKEAREFLTAAYNENDRLIRLVNNLLNISRIEAGRFTFNITKVDVGKIIEEVIRNLEMATREKNLFLTYEHVSGMPLVFADEDKIREVLINLIGNAIKFTHTGGVKVSQYKKEGMIVVAVTDTGSGIAKEDQELLFKKFSQLQGSYAKQSGGTGLGLYICKQIIEGLNGQIWLESELSKGSTFFFSLPIAE